MGGAGGAAATGGEGGVDTVAGARGAWAGIAGLVAATCTGTGSVLHWPYASWLFRLVGEVSPLQ
jgi:hypothetical protein